MKQFILRNKKAISAITISLVIGVVMLSFQDTPYVNQILNEQETSTDTVPLKKNGVMTMKEFDRLIESMDKEMLKVGDELKKIDLENIQKQAELSLKSIDMDKIMKDVELSLKQVDLEKIMADVTSSLKDINLDQTNIEIKNALKEANVELEKAKLEIKNIDRDEIKKELEKAKLELEKSKEEIKKIDIGKIMKEAKEEVDHAKLDLQELKTMFNEMENDGLINSKDGFKIEYKNKDLFINGEKQKQSVTDKYRKYFKEDHFKIEIEKE